MLLLLARWLHKAHQNCTIIARSNVDHYASIRPQTARFEAQRPRPRNNATLAVGGDGTIASRSINRENNVEALVIFKKIQFALESPNRYEFYSGAKKISGSGKSEQEHVPHFLHKKWKPGIRKFSGRFTSQSCNSTARKCTRKSAVFCKISVRRSKFCLEFSFTFRLASRNVIFKARRKFGNRTFLLSRSFKCECHIMMQIEYRKNLNPWEIWIGYNTELAE